MSATTTTEYIISQIRNQIISGELKSGDKLREVELCAQFNASRTPLREAFRILQSEGFLTHQPNVGVVVASITLKEYIELQEIRNQLEIISARHAAGHITDEQLDELSAINEQLYAACTQETTDLDMRFHTLIAKAGQNATVHEMLKSIQRKVMILGSLLPIGKDRLPFTYNEHKNIITALTSRDPELAAKYVDIHFYTSRKSATKKAKEYLQNQTVDSGE